MGAVPDVLYVDGDLTRLDAVSTFLEHRKPSVYVTAVESVQMALRRVETQSFDCIVSCYDLPDGSGLQLLDAVRQDVPDVPFILTPADGDEELASEAFTAGADQYHVHEKGAVGDLAEKIDTSIAQAKASRQEFDAHVLEDLLDHIPDTVYVKDSEGRFLKVSESKAREVQESRHTLRGASDFDHFERDAAEEMYRDEQRIIETGDPVINKAEKITTAAGEERWVLATKIPRYLDGEPIGTIGISRDITDRQEHLETIHDLHSTTENLVLAETPREVCESVVETATETLDFRVAAHLDPGEYVDSEAVDVTATSGPFVDVFETGDAESGNPLKPALADAFSVEETTEVVGISEPHPLQLPDGEHVSSWFLQPAGRHGVFCFGCTATNGLDQHTKDATHILTSNAHAALDRIDRRGRLEQKRREKERLERFSEEIAHDLRSPLSVATGAIELAQETGDESRLDTAAEALERIDAVVDEMLDLAKAGKHVSEENVVSLQRVVDVAWNHVETGDVTLSPPETDVEITAHRERLLSVFENLFRNAVEHGSPNSRTESDDAVEHGRPEETEDEPSQSGADTDLTVDVSWTGDGFTVTDDGVGIDDSVADGVFVRGVSGDDSGTGYGLDIVQNIVEAHGWDISLDTDVDGTRFVVSGVETVDGEND